jgi:hypothetical protein
VTSLRLKNYFVILAVLGTFLSFTGAHADSGAVEPVRADGEKTDVSGWRGLAWGTPVSEAARLFDGTVLDRQEEIEVAGCYFTRAVPISLEQETWQAWLCEDRDTGEVIGVSLEKGFRGVFFGDDRGTRLFKTFLAELTEQYGPAHRYWEQCHNARWNATVQYKWFFPSTTVTLLVRDVPDRWTSLRFERPNKRPDFGPGVCVKQPRDLRG